MPNGTYGGVRGRKTKVGGKLLLRFPPTRFINSILILQIPILKFIINEGDVYQNRHNSFLCDIAVRRYSRRLHESINDFRFLPVHRGRYDLSARSVPVGSRFRCPSGRPG